jgi:predicted RNase H-like HicB family nuclease
MPLLTIVEHYLISALRHGIVEEMSEGGVAAYVPEFPGIIANGIDVHDCTSDLYARLEEYVRHALAESGELPVVDGIDLRSERARVLASYHQATPPDESATPTFESNAAFEAELDRRDRIA